MFCRFRSHRRKPFPKYPTLSFLYFCQEKIAYVHTTCLLFVWYHRSHNRCMRWDMLQPKIKVTRFLTSRVYSPGRKLYSEISRLDHDRYPYTMKEMLNTYTTLSTRFFVRENISCSSKIELPYFSVEAYPILCIYCGNGGTKGTLNKSVEHYPQCQSCSDNPNVLRR